MSSKEYKKEIIDALLRKYNIRYAKNITTNRRIILKPTEVYIKIMQKTMQIYWKNKELMKQYLY